MMNAQDLDREIEARNFTLLLKEAQRDAMLDLVLTWGTLDGTLAMLLATIMGVPYHVAADTIGKLSGSAKLAQMIRLIRDSDSGGEAVRFLRKHKKLYEQHSKPRNKIAHGHCVGYLTNNEEYIVFAIFEKTGEGYLAVDGVPIQDMQRAITWGKSFSAAIQSILNQLDDD